MNFKPLLLFEPQSKPRPAPVQMLAFGEPNVKLTEFRGRRPDIYKVLYDLKAIKHQRNIDEVECQTEVLKEKDGEIVDVVSFETGKSVRKVPIRRDEEMFIVMRPKAKREKIRVVGAEVIPEVVKDDALDEERVYVEKMINDPFWEYKQTMEFKLKAMNEQLQNAEDFSTKLQSELFATNKQLQAQYSQLMAERKALLSMQEAEAPPQPTTDPETYFQDESLTKFYAYNQSLLAEIEARRAKAKETKPSTKPVKPEKLTPAVKKRPENWKAQNTKARLTTRMSQAFKSAERIVLEANRSKKLMVNL